MKKRILSLLLVFVMVLGMVPTVALAEEADEKTYEVTINVAPSAANVTFYVGSDTTTPLTGEVADNGVVGDYHQYVLTVPEGTYTYRGMDGETNLGGMTFEVPFDEEIMSDGTASGEGLAMTLRRVNYYTTNKAITAVGDYTLRLVPGVLPDVVPGEQYIGTIGNNSDERVVTPVLVIARGNALTYQQMVTVHGELGKEYAVKPVANVTFNPGTSAMNKTFSLSAYVYHTITAPQTATVEMFNQINNFNVERVTDRTAAEPDSDGNVTYTYKTVGGSNLTYRVSQTGKITRAGFLGSSAEAVVVTFGENENPKATGHQLDNAAIQKRMEASTMLNANGQNDLRLTAGDTFRLRAYRGAWQIVNTDTMNIMIEPDFHYDVISGGEHIDIDVVDDVCTGNATGNWMDITGVSAGTAIVEVTYDAIQIGGNGTSYDGFYGATDPQRSSLLVIQVGAGERTLNMKAVGSENLWDTEYDTVYFLGETGSLDFTATLGEATPDKVELSTDKGTTWTEVSAADGVYTVSGLIGGNNILRFTKENVVEYQVVRAAKVTQTITNLTRSEGIMAGDQLKIVYSGLYTPVAKFSGIYNPGFGQGHKVTYTAPEGYTVKQTGGQYDFISTNSYTITIPETALGEVSLTGGHIYFNVMGVADPLGGHRTLTDAGCGTNMSAVSTMHTRSVLPDVTFTVSEMPYIDVTVAANVENVQLTVKDSEGNALTPENGVYNLPLGTYTYEASLDGYITERSSFTVTLADAQAKSKTVSLTMRKVEGSIWDGTTKTEPEKDGNGVYQIGTGAELAWFASNHGNKNAVLTADISLGGFHWTPVTAYAGTFDGNGHWVTDMYLDSKANGQGLFAQLSSDGVIRNLGVRGVVTSTGKNVGGIMGVLRNKATVERCVSDVAVTGSQYVGGIAGQQYTSSVIQDCYNLGEITATKSYAGGISGGYATSVAFTIENCYSVGTITAPKNYGGLTWSTKAANGVNSYYVSGAADGGTATVGAVKTAAELQAMAQTLGEAWLSDQANVNGGYPILSWQFTEVPVTGLTLNKTSDELTVGGTLQLEVSFSPANATDTDVVWSSSNSAVASVENGVVTALAEGLATITVKTPDGAHRASCQVVVKGTDPLPTGPVTVYFSVSHDDNFVTGKDSDQTVALQQITVPYFDLELYGLQDYYFSSENYGDDGSGRPSSALEPGTAAYAKDKVTMLHLFIYATEIFYCGIDADKAGQGFLWKEGLLGGNALTMTGSVGSSYITKFWGMDENFNYYLNYRYPLASKGWGSTSDQILLKDGDIITLGHFSYYGFYADPNSVFNFMVMDDEDETVVQGDSVTLTVYRAGAQGGSGRNSVNSAYETAHTVVTSEPEVYYVNVTKDGLSNEFADWNEAGPADKAGKITLDTTDWEPGTYMIAVAGQPGAETTHICSAPGGILLTVEENPDKTAAAAVDAQIDAIGEVTLDSKETIEAARIAYDALTDEQKALVTKLEALTAAEATYAELVAAAEKEAADKTAAAAVDAQIDAIGEVTLDSKAAIDAACAAYDALTEAQKAWVTKADVLTAAEATYAELVAAAEKEAADKTAAAAVDALIDAIGEVTLDSKETIEAARIAYDALTDEQKALVTKLEALTAAEATYAELVAAADKKAADQAAANEVDALIDAIGNVTLSSKEAIAAARAAYEALTEDQKKLVDENVVKALKAAEEKLEELEQEKADKNDDKPGIHVPITPVKPVVKPAAPKMTFSDVSKADWFYDSVKEAYENGLIDGMSATEFDPNGKLTIAQAIKLAAALHQLEKTGEVTLKNGSDVWYSTYVDYAIANGIIDKAYGELSYAQMNAAATRSEFVAIFHGAKDFYAEKNTVADNAIPDVKMTDKNAAEIYEFYRAGILTGNDEAGTFAPNSSIKRSEVAAILIRMFDVSARQAVALK